MCCEHHTYIVYEKDAPDAIRRAESFLKSELMSAQDWDKAPEFPDQIEQAIWKQIDELGEWLDSQSRNNYEIISVVKSGKYRPEIKSVA